MTADRQPADLAALATLAGYPDAPLSLVAHSGSADLWRPCLPDGSLAPVVIKCPRGLSTKIRAEADALAALNELAHPGVPALIAADRDAGGLVMSWLHPACTTLDQWLATQPDPADVARVARQLGAWCASLHALHIAPGPIKLSADPLPWADRLIVMAQDAIDALTKRARRDPALQPALARCIHERDLLRAALNAAISDPHDPLGPRPARMLHRDLRPPNILVAPGAGGQLDLCGVVDWERAGAGDPAWDLVKLGWWCFEPHPALEAPFWQGYTALSPAPSAARIDLYRRFEALGLLATFAGKHPDYPDEATRRLDALSPQARLSMV